MSLLRNHVLAMASAFPNLPMGVVINGAFVGIDGVKDVATGSFAGIELVLDPDELSRALRKEKGGDESVE